MTARIVLTAGYDRALHVIVLAELLRRDGLAVCGVIVVTPFQLNRLRHLVRQRGWRSIKTAAGKLVGKGTLAAGGEFPVPMLRVGGACGCQQRFRPMPSAFESAT